MPGQNFEVAAWLRDLGMERYTQAFLDAEVTPEVLRALTEADLRELGLPLGPRKIVLHAIRRLASPSATRPVAEAAAEDARPGATPSPRPERRLITVMFIDLVGSTALSIRLDPEDFRELIGAYQVRVTAAVERAGGFVAKYMGDGVLAYFGYPHAHEDDPERAIRAALELTTSPQGLERPAGTAIEIRAGIATGLAVVGDLLGRGAAQEWAVVGETPNLAARLQAVADPNSVVIAETTRRMVGGLFDCRDLGPVQAKGFPAPIRAYRVLGPAAVASRFEALHASPAPLVGREEEMRLLLRRWEQAREGQGQVLVLSGEAGVGKSRLLAAVQEKLHGESPSLLRYFCSPHGRDSPFHPVIAQLERAAGFSHGDAPEVRRAKLEALLAQTSPTAKDLALLAEMLSLPLDNRSGSLPPSPHRKREQTFAVLLRGIERLSGREPVLMVFEDVHWIDPSSREFLDLVVGQADRLRILLLVTCRPEFDAPWTNRPHVTALSLQGIGQHEAANLVRLIAGTDAIPDELVTEIVERTDGMPLFIEELTKAVLEAGADRTIPAASPAKLAIPATLHASLMARLDRLDSAARAVAQAGAVIGREVPHELLVVVAGLDREELAAALDQLAAVELIHRRGEGPDSSYLFKHALVRDAAYGTLLRERRRPLHAAVAAALEQRFPELIRRSPELVAHHLDEAGEAGRAVGYWLEAGQRAAERSADREAVSHLRRGLAVIAGLPASEDRDRIELEFQLAIGTPLIALSGWSGPQVAAAYEQAAALCDKLEEPGRLVPALFGLASNRVVRGETHAALEIAERCRAAAERRSDQVDRILAHRARGAALMQLGELREARSEFEAIPALYDPERDRDLAAHCVTDPRASGLSFLALVLWMMGLPDQALRAAEEAARHSAALQHANTTGHILCHCGGELAMLLHDAPSVRRCGAAVTTLLAEHDMPMWRGYGLVLQGWAAAEAGQLTEGLRLVSQGIEELDVLGTVFHRTYHLSALAEIHGRLGDPDAGRRVLEIAYEEMRRTEVHLFEASLLRLEGDLRVLGGGEVEAEKCFVEALVVARRQGAQSFELRAATRLARLWQEQGRGSEAYQVLAPVYGWFTEGFDTLDLKEAKGILDGLRKAHHGPAKGPR